ncbi:hypothetical protein CVT24_008525 [Panaeolus cyanescens]|uniref:Serine aminopeptidase S33 domain-containing protein n=1 Tax=Panaeolus cyanescens TaxID=181874 RepID=A0A409VKX5_9AGAR|nr:hypothetical protein CVT24_008525 [Panaeolus cyanescens]
MGLASDLLYLLRHRTRIFIYSGAHFPNTYRNRIYRIPYYDLGPCGKFEHLGVTTPDNIKLVFYRFSHRVPSESKGTVIIFHGNGSISGNMNDVAAGFFDMGFDAIQAEYRGYGRSTGFPSAKGLRIDAQTVLDAVCDDPLTSQKPIIIFGHSLGGAVAIDLACRNEDNWISALILDNTFTSLPDVVKDMPIIGFLGYTGYLWPERWPSANRLNKLSPKMPILMLSGSDDRVVPPSQMKTLYEIAVGRGRDQVHQASMVEEDRGEVRFELLEGHGHCNNIEHPRHWEIIREFLRSSLKLNFDAPGEGTATFALDASRLSFEE